MAKLTANDYNPIHPDIVKKVEQLMPEEEAILNLADLFKLFSDSTRIRILLALANAEMCVYDLAALLQVSQSTVSHQLRLLRHSKLVKNRREGKVIYYTSDDYHVDTILNIALEHLKEGSRSFMEDLE